MRRRDFIKVIAAPAAVWPLSARAQQRERMRRIGVLMNLAADDKEGQARLTALVQALSNLGWKNASNVNINTAWERETPTGFITAQPSWSHSRLTSSWRPQLP